MFTVLSAKENDLDAVGLWLKSLGFNQERLHLTLPFTMLLRINDQLSGYIVYRFLDNNSCIIDDVFVLPEVRGKYFGDTLVRSLMNLLSRRGFDGVVSEKNKPFSNFLLHIGFLELQDSPYLVVESIEAYFKKPCKGDSKTHVL